MQKVYDELTIAFRRNNGVISAKSYDSITSKHATLFEDSDTMFILLQASGYPIENDGDRYFFRPYFTSFRDEVYCVVDIETNGSKPDKSQVIEIGAVKIQNGQIVDRLETYVACAYLPDQIIKLTGIEPQDLHGAPSRAKALSMLREFMGDAIFVAHNVQFDYNFLNASFERFGLGTIGNPKMCTIELAKRTFQSDRYGLAYLNETLGLGSTALHRAYCDAKAASKVMLKSFETVPKYVKTTDDLLRFSTSSKKARNLNQNTTQPTN